MTLSSPSLDTAARSRADADAAPDLVADIGATNARFGLLGPDGGVIDSRFLRCADHATLVDAAEAYLAEARPARRPRRGALAMAGPVTGDWVAMTNHAWEFSTRATRKALGLDRLAVVNDFTAQALAVPLLGPGDCRQVGDGTAVDGAIVGVIGPGTGLGVSGLVRGHDGLWTALAGEGGHVTMAPVDERESAVLDYLRRQRGHVSAERVLSGMGLTNLAEALTALDGRPTKDRTPAEVTEAALAGGDPVCGEAVAMFCAMLGTIAGNLALTLGARGGVYIGGGIVPRLGDAFDRSAFRRRFVEKGRLASFLNPIPTFIITHRLPAFLGLKAVLDRPEE